MKILSIDIGLKNFGMTVYCTETHAFTDFHLIQLGKVKDYVKKMKELSSTEPFTSASIILVENQMRQCMRTMAVAIRCFNYEKTIPVAPQSIKRFFKTSMKAHNKNKKAAITEAKKYLSDNMLVQFEALKKKDDIGDCILQTIWFLNCRQEHLTGSKSTA
tara:strand:- start:8 stop:487 length:480 start_codon:yes stop_codon:yes gene_type:complete